MASADLLLTRDRSAPAPPAQFISSLGRGQEIMLDRAARCAVAWPAAVLLVSRPGRAAVTRRLQVTPYRLQRPMRGKEELR